MSQKRNIGAVICAVIAMSLCGSARAQTTCFGVADTYAAVCAGHGTCVAADTCICYAGYTGPDCAWTTCFGISQPAPNACSGHGTCVGPNTCECHVGFVGDACESMVIPTVTVGNPGNPDDTHGHGYGGVDYEYRIGKYEVTIGQYVEFLNAVAATDTYFLYSPDMDHINHGCPITRNGVSGSYTYSFGGRPGEEEANCGEHPITIVYWDDAARFCNWLHNGQPGLGEPVPQDENSTEDGSYFFNGLSYSSTLDLVREPDATWVIPTHDEWYKAAYYDGCRGVYYDYPTGTDVVPNNGNPEGRTGNTANFDDGDYTIGSPIYSTVVGSFGNSESPYGTFDQGGNVWEYFEGWPGYERFFLGGSFFTDESRLYVEMQVYYVFTLEHADVGFRVARVVPPCTPDLDGNGDVDLYDFAAMQRAFTGPRQ